MRHQRLRVTNFGDAISPLIIRELTSQRVVWAPIARAEVVAIGSLLNTYASRRCDAYILGSGIRTPEDIDISNFDEQRILSVRGLKTAAKLGLGREAATGDPGLAVRGLVNVSRRRSREVLLVPHLAVANGSKGRRAIERARLAGLQVVLANEEPLEVARRVAASRMVVTSSLHAMVFADALGVPVRLVSFDDAIEEPGFKYEDYESIFGIASTRKPIADVLAAFERGNYRESDLDERTAQVASVIDRVVDDIYTSARQLA